jgi:aspartyl-tRNA(Asn)/glutamyl-tRNA(Gln) amidotransferase subunit A
MDLTTLTIKQLHEAYVAKTTTVADVVAAYKAKIDARNGSVNAYLEVFTDLDAQAAAAQKRIDDGTATTLTGVPFAIKDNILIEGRRAGAASKALEGYVAPYTATAARKLIEQGAIALGRVNMDEFAMGGSTENSAYGPTSNPIDEGRVSGGSSGGSAAAVAMEGACFALGSDTGGSIRQPASLCGVVGFKPTYGSVSRHGLIAMTSSLDVIGPITKTAEDAKIVYDAIKGIDTMDATSAASSDEPVAAGKIVGVPRAFLTTGIDADVLADFEASLERLKSAGYEIKDVDMPNLEYSLAAYYVIMPAEVSSNMARFDGLRYGAKVEGDDLLGDYLNTRGQLFGKEVRRRIMLGTHVLSTGYYDAYYGKACQARSLIRDDFDRAFERVDFVALPTSPVPAFRLGEKSTDPLSMYLADIFTVSANLAGVPAVSVPSGMVLRPDADGAMASLPVGLQLIGPAFSDSAVLDTAAAFAATAKK